MSLQFSQKVPVPSFHRPSSPVFGGVQPYSLSSDLEDAQHQAIQQQRQQQQQHDLIQDILNALGNALTHADETLSHLEDNADLLPTAIVRKCQEMADGVGQLARELEQHSPQEQQEMAQACLEDYNRSLFLLEEGTLKQQAQEVLANRLSLESSNSDSPTLMVGGMVRGGSSSMSWSRPTVDDFLQAIQSTSPLLRDIQVAFAELSEEDAEDIADAALTLARLLLMTLQSIHSTLTPQNVVLMVQQQQQPQQEQRLHSEESASVALSSLEITGTPSGEETITFIEELFDDDDDVVNHHSPSSNAKTKKKKISQLVQSLANNDTIENSIDVVEDLLLDGESSIPQKLQAMAATKIKDEFNNKLMNTGKKMQHPQRVKVLWPRLSPHVNEALHWGQDEAAKQPLLAVALGLTLWPAAIVTSVVGGSLLLVDQVVQDAYEHHQAGPFLSSVEHGAAQVVQAGKLGWVITSVVTKQSVRVVQRQVKRRGGVEKIAKEVQGLAMDRITHPVETVGMAWNGLVWGVSAVQDTVQHILQQREELLNASVSA